MRSTLPLAVLCCMLAAHLAAGTRNTITTNRALLARPVASPLAIAVNLTRQQFVQATWALQDVTCANFKDKTYASFRVGVRFNSTNSTQVRDDMWRAIGDPKVAGLCTGGYDTSLYAKVAALFDQHEFKVSQNNGTRTNMFFPGGSMWVQYAGPCAARPRPSPTPSPSPSPSPTPDSIVRAPVVDVPVASTSCDPADVQALADAMKAKITTDLNPADAALVDVLVVDCEAAGTSGRRLLQSSNITVTLRITVSPLAQSAAEVEAAARAVYEAVTGNPSESLPEGASLDTVLQILNQDLVQGDAQRLLERVQEAIVQQNLTSLFNATLTNATAISGVPATTPQGAAWPAGGCTNQTQCTATCTGAATGAPFAVCNTITGTWSAPSGTCTPIRCTGVPQTIVANANWLTNCATTVGSTCTANCIGAGTPSTATCTRVGDTTAANWAITTTGSCTGPRARGYRFAKPYPASLCGSVPDGCGGQCARVCDNQNMCDRGTCVCKSSPMVAATRLFNLAAPAASSQTGALAPVLVSATVDGDCVGGKCLAKTSVFQVASIAESASVLGNRWPQEAEGMFNGMPWKDFITNGGKFEYQW
ncbi:hypothetical protein COO60DRAFT_1640756 [Scenedesmus sp. NREL 46B-D3]|nr:hypothetical protein COO60DRAFT_1640756 [Scenedesmus sp. NREL 46B-D3]